MASTVEYVDFVCSQLKDAGTIRSRKMFGDWMVYVNEKPLVLCCDNVAYVKKHPALETYCADAECGIPYDGAKEHYILDIEHEKEAVQIVRALDKVTPLPKKKQRKA